MVFALCTEREGTATTLRLRQF